VFTGDGAHVVVVPCRLSQEEPEALMWDVNTGERRSLGVRRTYGVFRSAGRSTVAVWGEGGLTVADARGRVSLLATDAQNAVLSWDGALVAAVRHGEVSVYLSSSGKLLGTNGDPRKRVFDVAFDPRGERLAIAGEQGLVLWDPRWKAPYPPSSPCDGLLVAVAWSADGQRLAGVCHGRLVILGRDGGLEREVALLAPWNLGRLVFDGERVVWTDECQGVVVIDVMTGQETRRLDSACANGRCVCASHLSPSGDRALIMAERSRASTRWKLVDTRSGASLATLGGEDRWLELFPIRGSVIGALDGVRPSWGNSPDPRPLFAWDPRTDAALPPFGGPVDRERHPGPAPMAIDLSPDEKTMLEVTGDAGPLFTLVDRVTGARRSHAPRARYEGTVVGFSPGGGYVIVRETRGTHREPFFLLFDVADGRLRGQFALDARSQMDPLMSGDDRTVVLAFGPHGVEPAPWPRRDGACQGASCGELRVFDVRAGRLISRIPLFGNPEQLALDPTGALIFVDDRLIEAKTGRELWKVYPSRTPIFTNDGKVWIPSGENVALYDPRTKTLSHRYRDVGEVEQATPDGAFLLTRGQGRRFLLSAHGDTPRALPLREGRALLAPDGSYIAVADGHGIALVRFLDGAVLHRSTAMPALYYTDDGLYDGEPAAIDRVRFRLGPDLARSPMAAPGAPGVPSRSPGLLRDFLAGKPLSPAR
jgi:hypothetical protein